MYIRRRTRKHGRKTGAALSLALCLAVLFSMMPVAPVHAETAEYWKALMDEAEQNVKKYTQIVAADETAMNNAKAVADTAEGKIQPAKNAVDAAEKTLNLKSRAYIDSMITNTWNANDKTIFEAYQGYGDQSYEYYLSDNVEERVRQTSRFQGVVTSFENKYGQGTFGETYTYALGYSSVMEALDWIDYCNNIRGSREELAKYYVDVAGTEVPDVPQLRISPYMMTGAAMSAALNSCVIRKSHGGPGVPGVTGNSDPSVGHIFKAGGPCLSGSGQIIHSAERSDDSDPIHYNNPFSSLWSGENARKQKNHNKTIADPDYNVTGAGVVNCNPYKAKAVFSQDFKIMGKGNWKTYTTDQYRSGLKSACASELSAYNTKAEAYDKAVSDCKAAKTNYNNAVFKYNSDNNTLSNYKSDYNRYKTNYENASVTTYTIRFIDGLNHVVLSTQRVEKGKNAVPPTPPVYEGYTFTGWSSTKYMNVKANATIIANYEKTSTGGGNDSAGSGETGPSSDATQYTQSEDAASKIVKKDLKPVKGLKLKTSKGKITVKWKKAGKKLKKKFQGYEIQYTSDGTFKDYPVKRVGKGKKSATLKKLAKQKKYKVRIRRYREDGKVLHVSAWKVKKGKTK